MAANIQAKDISPFPFPQLVTWYMGSIKSFLSYATNDVYYKAKGTRDKHCHYINATRACCCFRTCHEDRCGVSLPLYIYRSHNCMNWHDPYNLIYLYLASDTWYIWILHEEACSLCRVGGTPPYADGQYLTAIIGKFLALRKKGFWAPIMSCLASRRYPLYIKQLYWDDRLLALQNVVKTT